ncbi:exonuclease RecJ [Humitalea rosea]|uniref:Single-stranded-DNA-specific exonuclease RecJ n=1 Tax=Humitalea rosea TaxID=990373 RepID=A0A2W7IGQ5_9PROT|nr:single-stranded-DNA-specific exonuclease RecJ [Humitalea rosea]PZW45834.1 exonuclease RecJ [Humitalea rosea]
MPDGLLPQDPAFGVAASLSGRRWVWRQGEARIAAALAERHALPGLVAGILAARGIGIETAGDFLAPTLRALMPDPARLTDMDLAADRIAAAVRSGEQVAVFGDYDVDGACSGALMLHVLASLGVAARPYVPDRILEGYGPNAAAITRLCDEGAGLIICVDCGTAAADALAAAAGRADVVVLDHHKAEGPPPPVAAVVNPNRLDDTSGLGSLCATGVAFMTAVATLRVLRRAGWFNGRSEPPLMDLLDLVALATVCDVMPLVGLNRAFVTQGLKVMASGGRPGIEALLVCAQAKEAPSAHTLGFMLGPRINAGGRVGQADLGLRLLASADPIEARGMAEELDRVNRHRQEVEADVMATAMRQAEIQAEAGLPVLLILGEGWHPGVVGIVAGRVKERFNRPAMVGGVADGLAKGSGRSVAGADLGAAVIAARQSGLFRTGGGHAMAAGFSFEVSRREEVQAFLSERLAHAASLPGVAGLAIEATVSLPGCTIALAEAIGRLAPFGAGNEEPILVLPRVRIAKADRVGKEGATIRAYLTGEGGGRLKAVCFRAKDGPLAQALLASGGLPLTLAGHLRAERWAGEASACFQIVDAAPVMDGM